VDELARIQPGTGRIIGDVLLQVAKLLFTSHQMVESIDLPESPTATERPVDLRRRVVFPGFALRDRCVLGREGRR
jgi:hypothetical protein